MVFLVKLITNFYEYYQAVIATLRDHNDQRFAEVQTALAELEKDLDAQKKLEDRLLKTESTALQTTPYSKFKS